MQHDSSGWFAASVSLTPLASPPQGSVPALGPAHGSSPQQDKQLALGSTRLGLPGSRGS